MSKHILEIHRNTDDSSSAYLTPEGEDCGYRIAGPKSWGDSWLIEELEVSDGDLIEYIRGYAPNVLSELGVEVGPSVVSELVSALEEIEDWVGRWCADGHPIAKFAGKALHVYRNQGGVV